MKTVATRELKLHELRTLDTLARCGSIVGTAKALYMSPAAVHKRLELLGEKLGVPLYDVIGHELRLTEAAGVVLPHVRTLLSHYEAIFSSLREWEGSERGSIRIATGTTISIYLLPALLEAFRAGSPKVEVVVETGSTEQLLDALAEGVVDAVMTVPSRKMGEPVYRVEARWRFEFVLVTSKEYPYGQPRMKQLADVPFILAKQGSRLGDMVEQYFSQLGFRPRVAMRFDNPETTKVMVCSGLGVALLPEWAVEGELRSGALLRIAQEDAPLRLDLVLVTRRGTYVSRALQRFVEMAQRWEWGEKARSTAIGDLPE